MFFEYYVSEVNSEWDIKTEQTDRHNGQKYQ